MTKSFLRKVWRLISDPTPAYNMTTLAATLEAISYKQAASSKKLLVPWGIWVRV
jgi:hypothetical protein